MSKAISYSLFGYNQETPKNCFHFSTYLRGLMVNIRCNRVLYPDWINIINIDSNTYQSEYKNLFDWLEMAGLAELNICPDGELLCKAMLWRLKPCFFTKEGGTWRFTHVLCRDIDSVATYREAQAVKQWIDEDKTIHCITDSVSHNIPMMGGMIGFRPDYLSMRLKSNSWDELLSKSGRIKYQNKGSDQDFLNQVVYPPCADSATEHFVLGMRHTVAEGDGRHYSIDENINIGINEEFKFMNTTCGHIGSAGFYEPPMLKFLKEMDPYRDDYDVIEKQFSHIFYWRG